MSVGLIIHQIRCGQGQALSLPRRRLLRIVRNSLWLSLTHYATPPFPQKSRSARLFGCKRPHDGSLSLPTFAVCGQGQALSLRYDIIFHSVRSTHFFSLFTIHFSLPDRAYVHFATQKMDYEFDSLFNHI